MRELWGNHGNTPVKFWQQGFARFVPAACVGSKDLYKLYDLFDGVGSEALEGSMMKAAAPDLYDLFR